MVTKRCGHQTPVPLLLPNQGRVVLWAHKQVPTTAVPYTHARKTQTQTAKHKHSKTQTLAATWGDWHYPRGLTVKVECLRKIYEDKFQGKIGRTAFGNLSEQNDSIIYVVLHKDFMNVYVIYGTNIARQFLRTLGRASVFSEKLTLNEPTENCILGNLNFSDFK